MGTGKIRSCFWKSYMACVIPSTCVLHLASISSNHIPIFLSLGEIACFHWYGSVFHFENAWLFEPSCRQVIETSWASFSSGSFEFRLNDCRTELDSWSCDFKQSFHIQKVVWCHNMERLYSTHNADLQMLYAEARFNIIHY